MNLEWQGELVERRCGSIHLLTSCVSLSTLLTLPVFISLSIEWNNNDNLPKSPQNKMICCM